MKITIKTTQQKVFQIDVEPKDTVACLKAKIYELQGHPVAVQKIIYSGKILTDDKTIDSCGIKEKDFLVLMVSKPKPTPTPAPLATSDIASESTVPPQTEPTIGEATSPEVTQEITTSPRIISDPSSSSAGDLLSGPDLQGAIASIEEMGFDRDEVTRAMRASFNNAHRAVEYLTAGFPSNAEADVPPPVRSMIVPPPAVSSTIEAPTPVVRSTTNQPQNLFQLAQQQQQGSRGLQPNPEAIRNSPHIQQIREDAAQNPGFIQRLIQQLGIQDPATAQMLADHPEAILNHLGVEHDGADSNGSPIPHGAQVISVTEEERAAIQRLEALGFPHQEAAVAYLTCDKNEELAANYLFEHFDEEDQ